MSASILITGGTAGLGFHAGVALAKQYPNHTITIASRTNTHNAADRINSLTGQTNTQYLPLNLSSLSAIGLFVISWSETNQPPITPLLLNAGLQFPGEARFTEDGYEQTFAVNHLGHALLFSLLIPHLAPSARIVITSSGTHDPAQKTGMPEAKYTSADELAHPVGLALSNEGRQRYTTSKLVNILWMYALERRFAALRSNPDIGQVRNWTVAAFDPGLVPGTGLARDAGGMMKFVWVRVLPTVIPLLRVFVSPNIHSAVEAGGNLAWVAGGAKSGVYYEGRREIRSSEESYDEEKQDDLWG
ncbi:short-chain dehydrogenase [Aspergillus karnatakaensis]|uniref:short-chain dehydrogenase n=1 Tax=Aspergillus karnatakaensis TaxID=1810916 RepID=UPI003CCC93C9